MNSTPAPARWSKSSPSWGSALRVQRNAYAYAVTMVMTSGRMECPACGTALDLTSAEVDRVTPSLDYCEGNVVYICHACNASRGVLQSFGNDWEHVGAYASDVSAASASVTVPSMRESREWWNGRTAPAARASRYA